MSRHSQTMFRNASPTGRYTTIDNRLLQATGVSPDVRGFVAALLSMPLDWKFKPTWAKVEFGLGETKMERIIRDAKTAGFMKVERERDPETGRLTGNAIYLFTDVPGVFSTVTPETPVMGITVTGVSQETENPGPGKSPPHTKETRSTKEPVEQILTPEMASKPMFHGNRSEEQKGQQDLPIAEPLPAKPKQRRKPGEMDASFEKLAAEYKGICAAAGKGGTVKGRSPGEKAWLKLSPDERAQISATLPAYGKELAKPENDYLHPQHISTFINGGWKDYRADPVEVEAEQEEKQVKAVAMDLQRGQPKYILQWWPDFQAIPGRVMQAARNFIADQGWEAQVA
jgi:hypothetical protein